MTDARKTNLIDVYLSRPEAGRRAFVPHHHTELELAFFRSGAGTYSVLNRTYPIETGDVFLFGNDELHKITEILPETPMEILNIHFAPRLLWDNEEQSNDSIYRNVFWGRNERFSNKLNRNNPAMPAIRIELLSIFNEWEEKSPCYLQMIHFSILKILILIARNFDYIETKEEPFSLGKSNFSAINGALHYMDRHFTEELSVAQLAADCNMTQNNFSLCFRRMNGMSPCNYLISKRINYAVSLLKNSDMGIFEIALESGYHNTANFNKAFRKLIGMTPGEYRKVQR